ncbi:ABC transporter permease [Amycolatopsis sp. NPDC049253]|uniref:ABC transporter permease n=1 Tax=Amycolatopsis sp. NPDC049253 TaxID=3155274 RepID=UPI003442C0C9
MSDTTRGSVVVTQSAPSPAPASGTARPPGRPSLWRQTTAQRASRGLVTILVATALLFLVSLLLQPESLGRSSLQGMLPFAAVLAVVALGQTLVVQQAGIDLSVPGTVSLSVIIVTHYPAGDNGKLLPAVLLAYVAALAAGLLNGLVVSRLGMSAIVTSLGTNALLYAVVLGISGGSPVTTTDTLHSLVTGRFLGLPYAVYIAVVLVAVTGFAMKRTVPGRRFEAVGDNPEAAGLAGLRVRRHQLAAYVWASLLYGTAGILLAGIVTTPGAFQGDTLLLPSVAAVVLGGTSLLGGKGSPVASAVAALFLSQLDQFVLTLGVSAATNNIVQALALAAGVAVYTVNWAAVRGWFRRVPAPRTQQ